MLFLKFSSNSVPGYAIVESNERNFVTGLVLGVYVVWEAVHDGGQAVDRWLCAGQWCVCHFRVCVVSESTMSMVILGMNIGRPVMDKFSTLRFVGV